MSPRQTRSCRRQELEPSNNAKIGNDKSIKTKEVLHKDNNSSSSPITTKKSSLKLTIRKSVVRRGREVALRKREIDDECNSISPNGDNNDKCHVNPLKGREKEFNLIEQWITESAKNRKPLSVYISGAPGTGKTATLNIVLQKCSHLAHTVIINCVSLRIQSDLIEAIFASQKHSDRPRVSNFEKYIENLSKPLVLVLDEIDHLCTSTNSLLYSAFKWPHLFSGRVIVIGIANSIDLTERLLPKLKLAKPPQTLVFAPYTKDNIREILEDKMTSENTKLDSRAIELCARKVAAMSGDLRTALHVYKTTKVSGGDNQNASNGCREVLGILNSVYSSPLTRARIPLQPRLLLAVCLCMSTNKKTSLNMDTIFAAYVKACDAVRVPHLENDDLFAAFQTLESQSFISTSPNGQIHLQVDSKTARGVISDNAMIDQISILNL